MSSTHIQPMGYGTRTLAISIIMCIHAHQRMAGFTTIGLTNIEETTGDVAVLMFQFVLELQLRSTNIRDGEYSTQEFVCSLVY